MQISVNICIICTFLGGSTAIKNITIGPRRGSVTSESSGKIVFRWEVGPVVTAIPVESLHFLRQRTQRHFQTRGPAYRIPAPIFLPIDQNNRVRA